MKNKREELRKKLQSDIGASKLAAKWAPRLGSKVNKTKKALGNKLRVALCMTPKEYRKLLVSLTDVVEQKMSAGKWKEIDFSKVPSVAMSRYMQAFHNHNDEGMIQFKNELKAPESKVKVNASAVYPYDIIHAIKFSDGDPTIQEKMWEELPNYLEGSNESLMCVVDTSGSMGAKIGTSAITAMDVAISLGIYISERSQGKFKDHFLTFSRQPKMQYVQGTLTERYNSMIRADWGMNTNITATYRAIFQKAREFNVPQSEMPTKLLILSDMQFDQGVQRNTTAQDVIEKLATEYGYEIPSVIYWNILNRHNDVPVKFDESGTALVSGLSPAILKSVLGGNDLTPAYSMLEVANHAMYSDIFA